MQLAFADLRNVWRQEEYKIVRKNNIVIVLDNIRSAMNVGSIFRTADAFLIEKIYLCGFSACPPHKDIHKTALGAEETVDYKIFNSTIDAINNLIENGYECLAVEQTDHSIMLQNYSFDKTKKYAFVLGNEVSGVDLEVIKQCNACIEIPQWGHKHSLNVTIAGGIVLWEMMRTLI
ncbi:MAG: RNA methyltransferase [Bacteroidales bacterium]